MNQIAPMPGPNRWAQDAALKSARVTKLLLSYPMAADDQFTMKVRLEAYLISVKGWHSSVVNEACERWLRAASGITDANYNFPPNPSQLALLCDRIDDEDRRRRQRSEPRREIPSKYDVPKSDLDRRATFMADMEAKFGAHFGIGTKEDEETEKRRASMRAQIKAASDRLRVRDFEEAGLPVPPPGSLEASPMLLRALEAKKQEAA